MRRNIFVTLAVVIMVFALSSTSFAVLTVDWYSSWTLAGLPQAISNSDILNGNFGTVEAGGFHPATPPPGEVDLTDGIPGAGVEAVLADFSRPSLQILYNLGGLYDLTDIYTFCANPSNPGNGRVWQTYDLFVSSDGINFTTTTLEATTGAYGQTNNFVQNTPGYIGATLIHIHDSTPATPFETGVQYIRFVFYCVSNTGAWYWDPWDVGEPRNSDGQARAFEASIIKEIDVFGTPSAGIADWSLY